MNGEGEPIAIPAASPAGPVWRHGAATWYAYLLLGYFTYLVSIQGNILPFLKAELDLGYRTASLHASVIAIGLIVVGFLGERFSAALGWRRVIQVGVVGSAASMVLLCWAAMPALTLASCVLFGLFGGLLPMTVNAVLADLHGSRRNIAFTEANAVAYAFAIMAPVLVGLCVWLGLGWRGAVLCGAAVGLATLASFDRTELPPVDRKAGVGGTRLPASFWLHAAALAFAVALEFSVLLWAPAYLERIVGVSTEMAAIAAAAFFVGMLAGRVCGTFLVHLVPARQLVVGSFATTLVGFAAYWSGGPAVAVLGLLILGLGIALTFPMLLGFAIGAAGSAAGKAASRLMLPPALAILLSPPLLGSLADGIGLGLAQLMTPVFAVLMLGSFLAGEAVRQ